MSHLQIGGALCAALFVGMLFVFTAARRAGALRRADAGTEADGSGAITAAIFALLGLLLAFAFAGAISRFDGRRQLIVDEANAIGTAYLRLNLLEPEPRAELRRALGRYAEARAAFYQSAELAREGDDLAAAAELEARIWNLAVEATRAPGHPGAAMLILPSLNEMFDLVTARTVAAHTHTPLPIYATLGGLALVCAAITGYDAGLAGRRSLLCSVAFAGVVAATLYLVLDIEFPRHGMIRLDSVNQLLVDEGSTLR